MKALLCVEHGPADRLVVREMPDPVPGDDDALVRVHAAGVLRVEHSQLIVSGYLARVAGGRVRFEPVAT